MREEFRRKRRRAVDRLRNYMRVALDRGGLAVLLVTRRGRFTT
jgi:hypothetical protein